MRAGAIKHSDLPEACEPLDVRRSVAVGILADSARALAMLTDAEQTGAPRKQSMLATFNLAGDPDGPRRTSPAGHRSPPTTSAGPGWTPCCANGRAGRADVDLTVRPVIHCGGCPDCDTYCHTRHQHTGYTTTDLDRERLGLWAPVCVFPHCGKPARATDCDHITPYHHDDPAPADPPAPAATSHPSADTTTDFSADPGPTPAGPTDRSNPASTPGPNPTDRPS